MPGAKLKVQYEDLGELLERLGDISPKRICMDPPPGTATDSDLIRKHGSRRALYELIDGTLVEKGMGHKEAFVAGELSYLLRVFLEQYDLGYCTGPDDLVRVM